MRLDVPTLQGHEGGVKRKDTARPGPRGLWVELGQERAARNQLVYRKCAQGDAGVRGPRLP